MTFFKENVYDFGYLLRTLTLTLLLQCNFNIRSGFPDFPKHQIWLDWAIVLTRRGLTIAERGFLSLHRCVSCSLRLDRTRLLLSSL